MMLINDLTIKFKKLNENAEVPFRGSPDAAGYDLYACITNDCGEITIPPHQTVKIGTGLAFELPQNTFGMIVPRSGLATKSGLRPANTPGVCDADYRGEYIVALHNDSDEAKVVKNKDRIAQLILMPFIPMSFQEAAELSETVRGGGGFASTGR